MPEERSEWQTPNEIRTALGDKKCRSLIEEVVHNTRSRPEILETITSLTKCNVYSADDFLRDLLKNPPKD
ncbi:MAG: hypothetical protein EXS64_18595 [Candidatus Latescibacteria bacterium]|nr:hypothetical protein [Candidatus Latescibacterota bacterium]